MTHADVDFTCQLKEHNNTSTSSRLLIRPIQLFLEAIILPFVPYLMDECTIHTAETVFGGSLHFYRDSWTQPAMCKFTKLARCICFAVTRIVGNTIAYNSFLREWNYLGYGKDLVPSKHNRTSHRVCVCVLCVCVCVCVCVGGGGGGGCFRI